MTTTEDVPAPAGGSKDSVSRSPRYPAFDLGTATDRAGKLYEIQKLNWVPAAVAIKGWGYSLTSGSGLRVLATMTGYGLVDEDGTGENKRLRVSATAQVILRHPDKASNEYRAALRDAALKPKIHAEVWEKYRETGLPDDHALGWELERNWKFQPGVVPKLIEEIRATFALAGLQSGGTVPAGNPAAETGKSKESAKPAPEAAAALPDARLPPAPAGTLPVTAAAAAPEMLDLPIPLIGGGRAVLRTPIPLTDTDFMLLRTMLTTMLDGMKAAIVRTPPPVAAPVAPDPVARGPVIEVGDLVQWTVNGQDQFEKPRRVTSLALHDGQNFVMVDGTATGCPLHQVTLYRKGG